MSTISTPADPTEIMAIPPSTRMSSAVAGKVYVPSEVSEESEGVVTFPSIFQTCQGASALREQMVAFSAQGKATGSVVLMTKDRRGLAVVVAAT